MKRSVIFSRTGFLNDTKATVMSFWPPGFSALRALCPYILLGLLGSLLFWRVTLALCPYVLLGLLGSLLFGRATLALCPYILREVCADCYIGRT